MCLTNSDLSNVVDGDEVVGYICNNCVVNIKVMNYIHSVLVKGN